MNCVCGESGAPCPACQQEIDLILGLEEPASALPSADYLWWKAQIHARREAAEKSARPIAIAERAGSVAAGAAIVIVLAPVKLAWAALIVAALLIPAIPVALWARHHSE